jgi:hypothetical protein
MGNLLDKKKLLERDELLTEKVEFENGDYVYVRQMTGHERDVFERSLYVMDEKGKPTTKLDDFRAKLAVVTICDEEGKLLLDPKDFLLLSNAMSAAKLEKVVNAAQKLNAISEADKEALVKNSDAGQPGNSSSASAEN